MTERKEFEAKYPMPVHAIWVGGRYAATEYDAWDVQAHQARWEGWQARAELGEGTPHCTEKLNALHANHIALQAECEALRKDAERFRWMRSHPEAVCVTVPIHGDWIPAISEQLDAAVDAAMGKEKA
jgi:hypothetical protein